nr:HepT-like ribonuclease domain-containing protein [uncultured Rhodoblastus sp.]
MRHRLIHAYADIRLDIVWDVVQKRLPQLIERLEPLVPPET